MTIETLKIEKYIKYKTWTLNATEAARMLQNAKFPLMQYGHISNLRKKAGIFASFTNRAQGESNSPG